MTTPAPLLYPTPTPSALKLHYINTPLSALPAPAAILDLAIIRRNCALMLTTTHTLGLGFRAHVKTHKTTELAKLQVDDAGGGAVKLVASTVGEIENLLPWLLECVGQGREVNILYGLPLTPSSLPRLSALARILGPGTIGLFIDHPTHITLLDTLPASAWPGPIPVWLTIDTGYHREGVPPSSPQLAAIAHALATSTRARLAGLYTHMGHSYAVSSPSEALEAFCAELTGLQQGALAFLKITAAAHATTPKITLSLGASPTATAVQNLLLDPTPPQTQKYTSLLARITSTLARITSTFALELHAGVYPVLDMQQLATRARPTASSATLAGQPPHQHQHQQTLLSYADLALRILVEVASLYPDRGAQPEALIAAGSIALGREPCKSYPGWGVVSPWTEGATQSEQSGGKELRNSSPSHYDPSGTRTGWIVGRVSQEHGVLTWEGPTASTAADNGGGMRELAVGEKLLVWPNHACIAGVNFGWYFVVDSDLDGVGGEVVRDVWVRGRGW
ncbi:hypothetical protein LTR08_005721 [Meristemomyces frigidus]|nr:hypothetical protein LTR08_005721 [Meristemomyces frigidus]